MNVPPHWLKMASAIDAEVADPDEVQALAEAEPGFVIFIIERARAKLAGDLVE